MLILWFARRRVTRHLAGVMTAFAFAIAAAVVMYQIEWFDMFRLGMPPVRYLVRWVPWIAPYAALGWFIGHRLVRERKALL